MTSIRAAANILSLVPKNNAFFYESLPCQAAATMGYNAIQFTMKAPTNSASLTLELQTRSACAAPGSTYNSYYYQVTNVGTTAKIFIIPFSSWSDANADAIVGITWSDWSINSSGWQLSNVQFTCNTVNTPTKSLASSSSLVKQSSVAGASSSGVVITSASVFISRAVSSSEVLSSLESTSTLASVPSSSGSCSNLVIEDFTSKSRMTFLYYNALLAPTSDDGTMKSVDVNQVTRRGIFTPVDTSSYWYTKLGCTNSVDKYGGISFRVKAPAGSSMTISLSVPSSASGCGNDDSTIDVTSKSLGWTFDGTEKLYSFKWSQFPKIDITQLSTMLIYGLSSQVTLGPISMFCGDRATEYVASAKPSSSVSTVTQPAPPGPSQASYVIDKFASSSSNALNMWHGGDDGMTLTWEGSKLKVVSQDPDYAFYSQFSTSCKDMSSYDQSYLHIKYSGSTAFSIAMQQHNAGCNADIAPFPETWDEVEASRYASNGDIYVPMSHFKVDMTRVIGVALKSWYTTAATTFTLIEIVSSVPAQFRIPVKNPTGNLVFACNYPNSFAFCIDDGDPAYAAQVMKIVKEKNIKVTFFTVGAPLLDTSNNLSAIYQDMMAQGHQIAVHTYSHPKMEGLPDYDSIDEEYNKDNAVVAQTFNGLQTPYMRPPFGTEGARMRYRWTQAAGRDDASIVLWSVDVQDWVWAMTSTPGKQLDAFTRDVDRGGNLVVMHYLYQSTVDLLPQFIDYAIKSGKQLMRLDQCMMDPAAPPL